MILSGLDIADYIKRRHYEQLRGKRTPVLAIVNTNDDPATARYLRAKQQYGEDIGAEVQVHAVKMSEIEAVIKRLNADESVGGIIVQLPLAEPEMTDQILDMIEPAKDIDGLGKGSKFDPATPTAILWLLAGYSIDPKRQTVTVVGQGRLVGKPLTKMLKDLGAIVLTADEHTQNLPAVTMQADVVVLASGQKHILKAGMLKAGAVIVDCGSPSPEADPGLLADDSLKITPVPGGVGPMTVAALFENLLLASRK